MNSINNRAMGLPSRGNVRPSLPVNNADLFHPSQMYAARQAPPPPSSSYSSHSHSSSSRHEHRSQSRSRAPPSSHSSSSAHTSSSHRQPSRSASGGSASPPLRPQKPMPSLRTAQSSSERPMKPMPPPPESRGRRNDGGAGSGGGGVLARMQEAGWVGVGSSSASSDDGAPVSISGSDRSYSRSSDDSGFAEGSGRETDAEKGTVGYMESWNKLKKVVWGEEGQNGAPTHASSMSADSSSSLAPLGSTLGNKLWSTVLAATAAASHNVAESVAKARGDDDDTVGQDGETKLGRMIKEYHISRASSADELPTWLFSPAELAARSRATTRSYSTSDSQQDDTPLYGSRHAMNTPPRTSQTVRRPQEDDYSPSLSASKSMGSSSRAANRLRQMREEKRSANIR